MPQDLIKIRDLPVDVVYDKNYQKQNSYDILQSHTKNSVLLVSDKTTCDYNILKQQQQNSDKQVSQLQNFEQRHLAKIQQYAKHEESNTQTKPQFNKKVGQKKVNNYIDFNIIIQPDLVRQFNKSEGLLEEMYVNSYIHSSEYIFSQKQVLRVGDTVQGQVIMVLEDRYFIKLNEPFLGYFGFVNSLNMNVDVIGQKTIGDLQVNSQRIFKVMEVQDNLQIPKIVLSARQHDLSLITFRRYQVAGLLLKKQSRIEVEITGVTQNPKVALLTKFLGKDAIIPQNQLDVQYHDSSVEELQQLVGSKQRPTMLELGTFQKPTVLSVIKASQLELRQHALTEGQLFEGEVTEIQMKFGTFMIYSRAIEATSGLQWRDASQKACWFDDVLKELKIGQRIKGVIIKADVKTQCFDISVGMLEDYPGEFFENRQAIYDTAEARLQAIYDKIGIDQQVRKPQVYNVQPQDLKAPSHGDVVQFQGQGAESQEQEILSQEQGTQLNGQEPQKQVQEVQILEQDVKAQVQDIQIQQQESLTQEQGPQSDGQQASLQEQEALPQEQEASLQEQEASLLEQEASPQEQEASVQEQEALVQEQEASLQGQETSLQGQEVLP